MRFFFFHFFGGSHFRLAAFPAFLNRLSLHLTVPLFSDTTWSALCEDHSVLMSSTSLQSILTQYSAFHSISAFCSSPVPPPSHAPPTPGVSQTYAYLRPNGPSSSPCTCTVSSTERKLTSRDGEGTQQTGFSIQGPWGDVYSSHTLDSAGGFTLRRSYMLTTFIKMQKRGPKWPTHISKTTSHFLSKASQVQWI